MSLSRVPRCNTSVGLAMIFLFFAGGHSLVRAQSCNFYVSPNGNDGSAEAVPPVENEFSSAPFQTLQAAETYLESYSTTIGVGRYPITVCAYSGNYSAPDATPSEIAASKDVNNYNPHTYTGGTVNDVLDIQNLPGTAANPVTFTAVAGNTPSLTQTGFNAIKIGINTSYVVVNGFTVYGITNDFSNVDYPAAVTNRYANGTPGPWPYYDGNCITIAGDAVDSVSASNDAIARTYSSGNTYLSPTVAQLSQIPSHITIQNNYVYGCGGGGISALQADYVTILNNTVSGCSHYSIYGTSGISVFDSVNADGNTNTRSGSYKNVVRGNRVWGNAELVPWVYAYGGPAITDGEGIIIDTNLNNVPIEQSGGSTVYVNLPAYLGRTLVADNVITGNGGPAVEILSSYYVDVLDNSTYGNIQTYSSFAPSTDGISKGEFFVVYSAYVNAANNIFSATQPPSPQSPNTNPTYPYGGGHTPVQYSIRMEKNIVYADGASVTAPATADSYGVKESNDYYYSSPWYISPASSTWNTQANLQVYVGSPALSDGTGDAYDTSDISTDIMGAPFLQSNGAYAIGAFATGVQGN